jgi:hypothetical protein
MKRTLALLLCGASLFAQPVDSKLVLLRLTDELDAAIRAGDWNHAAALSAKLKADAEVARNQSMAKSGNELADQFLDWLPPDTETVLVAQQPFKVPEANQHRTPELLPMVQSYTLLFAAAEKQKLADKLKDRTVRFAALGARAFGKDEKPRGLGMVSLEGCAVYLFAEPLQESIFERKPDESAMGHPVWISKGELSDAKDSETFIVALPRSNMMLACNNRDFFSTMVSRMSAPQKPRALPVDLPEWKHVNRGAPLWGLRHVGQGFDPGLMIDPEKKDISIAGLTVEFNTSEAKSRTFSNKDPWARVLDNPQFESKASSKKITEGIWELSVSGNGQAGYMSVFVLMGMLGFVVLV